MEFIRLRYYLHVLSNSPPRIPARSLHHEAPLPPYERSPLAYTIDHTVLALR